MFTFSHPVRDVEQEFRFVLCNNQSLCIFYAKYLFFTIELLSHSEPPKHIKKLSPPRKFAHTQIR